MVKTCLFYVGSVNFLAETQIPESLPGRLPPVALTLAVITAVLEALGSRHCSTLKSLLCQRCGLLPLVARAPASRTEAVGLVILGLYCVQAPFLAAP